MRSAFAIVLFALSFLALPPKSQAQQIFFNANCPSNQMICDQWGCRCLPPGWNINPGWNNNWNWNNQWNWNNNWNNWNRPGHWHRNHWRHNHRRGNQGITTLPG